MYRGVCVILPLYVAASPAAAQAENEALNGVYRQLSAARAAGDVEGMAGAFGPAGLLVDQRPGPVISGAELGARLRPMAERLRADNVRIDTAYRIERRSMMGDIAIDAGYMRQTLRRPDGQVSARYARFLVTMRRGANGWRIIGDASMPADEAAWIALARREGLHFDG
jgi:ketosteroid isomerase-like protein